MQNCRNAHLTASLCTEQQLFFSALEESESESGAGLSEWGFFGFVFYTFPPSECGCKPSAIQKLNSKNATGDFPEYRMHIVLHAVVISTRFMNDSI